LQYRLARVCKQIDDNGLILLSVLDKYLGRFEYVPEEFLFKKSHMNERVFTGELGTLRKFRLVEKHPSMAAYRLTYMGLDCLAIISLVREGVITHIGPLVGTGKESVLYLAKVTGDAVAVIKLYKIGRVSFKKVVRYRGYVVDQSSWLEASKIAAEREYKVLTSLMKYTSSVPKVWGWNRHAVVMEYIEGVDLYRYRDARDPQGMLNLVLATLRTAYINVGIVHADLSEYNIVVSVRDSVEVPFIIDWPQYVSKEDPVADVYLRRDLVTIIRFFKRRYGVSLELERAINYIKGLTDGI